MTKLEQMVAGEQSAADQWECAWCSTPHPPNAPMFCSVCGIAREPLSLLEALVQEALAQLLSTLGDPHVQTWSSESDVTSFPSLEWGEWLAWFLLSRVGDRLARGQLHRPTLYRRLAAHLAIGDDAPCQHRTARLLIRLTMEAERCVCRSGRLLPRLHAIADVCWWVGLTHTHTHTHWAASRLATLAP